MICLDIETLDFFSDPAIAALPRSRQIEAIRFGLAVTIDSEREDGARIWDSNQAAALWEYLCTRRSQRGDRPLITGWNIIDFDYPIIRRHAIEQGYSDSGLVTPPTLDMFDRIRQHTGRWYKLSEVAIANGVGEKAADGQQAALWLRAGEFQRAAEYCAQDVRLTMRLYEIAQDIGIVLPARPGRRYPEYETLRLWVDGDNWRLRNEESGEEYMEEWGQE